MFPHDWFRLCISSWNTVEVMLHLSSIISGGTRCLLPISVMLLLITTSRCCLVSPPYTYYFYSLQFVSNLWGFLNCSTPLTFIFGTGNPTVSNRLPFSHCLLFYRFIFIMDYAFLFAIVYNSLWTLMILMPKLSRFGHWSSPYPASSCVLVKCIQYFFEHFLSFLHKMFQFHLVPSPGLALKSAISPRSPRSFWFR